MGLSGARVSLFDAKLDGCDATDCDARGWDLAQASCVNVNFTRAVLVGARLTGSMLGAILTDANTRGIQVDLNSWELAMSSTYPGPQNVKDAITQMRPGFGCGTTSGDGQFIVFRFPVPVRVDRFTIGAMHSGCTGGWNHGYTNGRSIQFSQDGEHWTQLFVVDGVPMDGLRTFDTPSVPAQYFRLHGNGYVALSFIKFESRWTAAVDHTSVGVACSRSWRSPPRCAQRVLPVEGVPELIAEYIAATWSPPVQAPAGIEGDGGGGGGHGDDL
jgi:hypothetical protein